jgi:acyl-homoserine-lactone acylase
MIADRVAGTDGLGKAKFSIPTLQKMWENDRSLAAELFSDDLAAACTAGPQVAMTDGSNVDVSAACPIIKAYDGTGNLGAKGGWLFSEWYRRLPSAKTFGDKFDPAKPLDTPSKLNVSDPAILQSLAGAVQDMKQRGIALDASYGDVQHATRGKKEIPIHGCFTGCFQNISAAAGQTGEPAGYGEVTSGSSLVMTTELTANGPKSEGILTYSQATDPTSPWYGNLTALFSKKRWVPMRFSPRELAQDRNAQTQILAGR